MKPPLTMVIDRTEKGKMTSLPFRSPGHAEASLNELLAQCDCPIITLDWVEVDQLEPILKIEVRGDY